MKFDSSRDVKKYVYMLMADVTQKIYCNITGPKFSKNTNICHNDDIRLMIIFQDSLGKPAPKCLHSGFYCS